MKFRLLIIICVTTLLGSLWRCPSVMAQTEQAFHTALDSHYRIASPSGATSVTHEFTITNTTSTQYLTKYSVTIAADHLESLAVTDAHGPLRHTTTSVNGTTIIAVEFSDKSIGKDQHRQFRIDYRDPQLADQFPTYTQVLIPPLLDTAQIASRSARISVARTLGAATIALPDFSTVEEIGEQRILQFQQYPTDTSLFLLFGTQQSYAFDLEYQTTLTDTTQSVMQLPLPPDTEFQTIQFSSLTPQPTDIKRDDDGNWIATYENIPANTSISVQGIATLHFNPVKEHVTTPLDRHTTAQPFWEVTSPAIQEKAKHLSTKEHIFTYTTQELAAPYQWFGKYTRAGARATLEHPKQALAQDRVDVLISLARALHIPARQTIGMSAHTDGTRYPTTNDYHTWAQLYDQTHQYWAPYDPTWQYTSGGRSFAGIPDLSTVALAIQGVSSTQPLPPNPDTPTLKITRQQLQALPTPPSPLPLEVQVELTARLSAFFGFGDPYIARITNTTPKAWYDMPVVFDTAAPISISAPDKIDVLLPYQTVEIPLTITSSEFFRQSSADITLTILDHTSTHTLAIGSLVQQLTHNPIIIAAIGLLFLCVLSGIVLLAVRFMKKL